MTDPGEQARFWGEAANSNWDRGLQMPASSLKGTLGQSGERNPRPSVCEQAGGNRQDEGVASGPGQGGGNLKLMRQRLDPLLCFCLKVGGRQLWQGDTTGQTGTLVILSALEPRGAGRVPSGPDVLTTGVQEGPQAGLHPEDSGGWS